MLGNRKAHVVLVLLFCCAALMATGAMFRAAAQTATATILGTVTDPSGAAVPDAAVRVTNTGTGVTQSTTSDTQGRYRVPDLPIGDYDVETEKMGFQTVDHKGITLSIGAQVVVDFALPVGQVAQTVTVEGEVSQVETTTAQISNLVDENQVRNLPLNGRDFEQLVLLSPGVTVMQAQTLSPYLGFGNEYSISGSRPNGQGEYLDGTDIQDFQQHGSGSGVLGTSLGVDAIAEFEVLTNTYGAQYGGNGGVVNSVTRSGTNTLHGSAYEFFRNSALDARNFFDPAQIPEFQKNQFGGTLGGPIKKDKMFFFANYEGIRQVLGETKNPTVPDVAAINGFVPNSAGTPICVNNPNGVLYGTGDAAALAACAATIPATIKPYIDFYKGYPQTTAGTFTNGVGTITQVASEPGTEDYVVGRYDWNISDKDSIFERYLFDGAHITDPFYGGNTNMTGWPAYDRTRNQFNTIEEKHIWTPNLITTSRFGFTRTLVVSYTTQSYVSPDNGQNIFEFSGNLYSGLGYPPMDGSLSISGLSGLPGAGQIDPFSFIQNKFSFGEDLLWTKGAHTFRFGGEIKRVQSYANHPFPGGGTWTFQSLTNFLTDVPTQYNGPAVDIGSITQHAFSPYPNLPFSAYHQFHENDYALYMQDDWKLRPNLTLNLGLRYEPTTNPVDGLPASALLNPPFAEGTNPNEPLSNAFTAVDHAFSKNISLRNLDPRIGIAWSPGNNQKTSIRAGYGIFHIIYEPRDYVLGFFFAPPAPILTQSTGFATGGAQVLSPGPFTNSISCFNQANPAASNCKPTLGTAFDYDVQHTPYIQQWNLTVQREIMKNTVATVGYVGSHGVHLISMSNENPPLPDGNTGAITLNSGTDLVANPVSSSLICTTGTCTGVGTGGDITCTAGPCSVASSTGGTVLDPNTHQLIFSNTVKTISTGKYAIQPNVLVNPNLGYLDAQQTIGFSTYNALQAGVVRRMTNNLQAQASYTYSYCIDEGSAAGSLDGGNVWLNPYDPSSERGKCIFMIRHNVVFNTLYVLPFHQNRLVEGWQVGGILTYHSGTPLVVTDGIIWAYQNGTTANRPNVLPNCNQVLGGEHLWLNTSCYALPPVGEQGNLGRDSIFGPDSAELDANIQKNTKINERFNLQFRAEFFNVTNRVNFRNPSGAIFSSGPSATSGGTPLPPSGVVSTGTAGVLIAPTNTTSRQIQFGLKLLF